MRSLAGLPFVHQVRLATAESCAIYCPRSANTARSICRACRRDDASAGRLVGDDDDPLARPKCRSHKLADLVQAVAVIGMELTAPAACDSRERGQGWHEQPPCEAWSSRRSDPRVRDFST